VTLVAIGSIAIVLVTGVAASKSALPDCEAVTEHDPTPVTVTSPADVTVQGPEPENVTVRPEEDDAVTLNGAAP
jgi:hypothetical protein